MRWVAGSIIIKALLVGAVFDHSAPHALRTRDGEVVGTQIIVADKARSTSRRDATDFSRAIAAGAFNIDYHGKLTFMMRGTDEQFMVQNPLWQSMQGTKPSS